MDVLGHDDVADHDKMVAPAHLFEHRDEQIVVGFAGEPGTTVIATSGDVMQVACAVIAMKSGHGELLSQVEIGWL
jgi:hypothetical protein